MTAQTRDSWRCAEHGWSEFQWRSGGVVGYLPLTRRAETGVLISVRRERGREEGEGEGEGREGEERERERERGREGERG